MTEREVRAKELREAAVLAVGPNDGGGCKCAYCNLRKAIKAYDAASDAQQTVVTAGSENVVVTAIWPEPTKE